MAEENQVYVLITFDILITYTLLFSLTNTDIVCFVPLFNLLVSVLVHCHHCCRRFQHRVIL